MDKDMVDALARLLRKEGEDNPDERLKEKKEKGKDVTREIMGAPITIHAKPATRDPDTHTITINKIKDRRTRVLTREQELKNKIKPAGNYAKVPYKVDPKTGHRVKPYVTRGGRGALEDAGRPAPNKVRPKKVPVGPIEAMARRLYGAKAAIQQVNTRKPDEKVVLPQGSKKKLKKV